MSESNRVSLKYIPEVSYGTTPVNSALWKFLRFVSETLSGTTNTTESAEIRSDRMISDLPKVGTTIEGGISCELSPDTYDDFFEAVLGGTWTTNVLKVGTTSRSFTLEKTFEDISERLAFKGMRAGQLAFKFEYGALATLEINFAGNNYSAPATSLVGSGSVAAATTTPILNNSANISGIEINGIASTLCFKTLNLNINGNLRPMECIGSDAPSNQLQGSVNVTGDFSAYLDNLDLEDIKIANTSFSLEFTATVGGQGYTFFLPKLKFGGSSPAAGGRDQDVMLEGAFSALYNTTENSSIVITRI